MNGATPAPGNIDAATVASFGEEWARFEQADLAPVEIQQMFDAYFDIFPWDRLPTNAEGFDMGCGSGRWARRVAPRVGRLHCIDPAAEALTVARKNLAAAANTDFHHCDVEAAGLAPDSQDFGYSLGVLHHIPDTPRALAACVRYLKPGAPFLLYLYYRFDNRPAWFRALWKISELARGAISALPNAIKPIVTDLIAVTVYWPLARIAKLCEAVGYVVDGLPLSYYRTLSLYTMRTDSRDRFGTPLEQRFTKAEIAAMMTAAGLTAIRFSPNAPYWCAVGFKQA